MKNQEIDVARLRLEFEGRRGAWFNLMLFSPAGLARLAGREGWQLTRVFPDKNYPVEYGVMLTNS